MTDQSSPEKSPWGWRALIIFCILGALFMGLFWLAVSNEPDYMPSQQKKDNTQQHAFKNAPAMSQEQMAEAQQQQQAREAATSQSAAEMHMTEEEHAHMTDHAEASSAHGH
ncbi:hypothetical protein B9T26_06225 [Acinetobacter sp. ANC 4169]|uniref:hypothetical protein n=1 Tax=Acinetobacter sp. ANC 4169 TaxID=1977879 RepID=UPI000A358BD1|nr:hypothetical protein [Acinetobacter sp. ANC 4169]OTG75164.1 hypothetical protein B9T26_06225 [Acinetobacter sp. ANC 4169]